MDHQSEELQLGPTLDAPTAEERIQARRDRIAKRVAAANMDPSKAVKEPEEKTALDAYPHKSSAKVEASQQYLEGLRETGTEKVSLVRATADLAECKRRDAEDTARRERLAKLQQERAQSLTSVSTIASQWSRVQSVSQAAELKELLDKQQAACEQVVAVKDSLISELQLQLKTKDDEYVRDLRTQATDIDTLLEFMNEQTVTMTEQYKLQLEELEHAFMDERKEFIAAARKEWNDRMQQRRELEEQLANQAVSRTQEHNEALDLMQANAAEEYAILKIKLEVEIQQLEQQLQQMRATYQLNSEKLEYNFQVLKKRDEENAVTLTQQKRRIARLQDVLSQLKKKLSKQESSLSEENQSLSEDFRRVNAQFNDLQKKFRHFQSLDQKRYEDMWEMNKETVVELATDVLEADRAIHEQQLGLKWVPPAADIFDDKFDYGGSQTKSATGAVEDLMSTQQHALVRGGSITAATVKKALNLLCDEAGFLVDGKLSALLEPLEKKAQSMMKLDSIFKALGVENEEDVFRLASYFVQPGAADTPELIHANDVNVALRRFVEDCRKLKGLDTEEPLMSSKELQIGYWDRMANILPEDHDRVWSSLTDAMEKYVTVLEQRATMISEAEELKQQNGELRMLLQQYMSSKMVNDLEVPPLPVSTVQKQRQFTA
eukprot:m.203750 g.203750  ORF g.203750 m.203750 type:complete len:662 (-) comp21985_c0_seq10:109-2094(-)